MTDKFHAHLVPDIDVDPMPEHVNDPDAEAWMREPESNFFQALVGMREDAGDAFWDTVRFSTHHTIENKAAEEQFVQRELKRLGPKFNDVNVNPLLSVKELNERYPGTDHKKPMTMLEADIRYEIFKTDREVNRKFVENLSWDDPLDSAAILALMAGISAFTPFNYTVGASLGAVGTPILGILGVATKTGVEVYRKLRIVERLAKQARKIKAIDKAAKAAGNVTRPGVMRALQLKTKIAQSKSVSAFTKKAGLAGATNGLEEALITNLEAKSGIPNNPALSISIGVFAPAILQGMAAAIKGVSRSAKDITDAAIRQKRGYPDSKPGEDLKAYIDEDGNLNMKVVQQQVDLRNLETIDEVVEHFRDLHKKYPDHQELLDSLKHMEAMQVLEKAFEPGVIKRFFSEYARLLEDNFMRPDFAQLSKVLHNAENAKKAVDDFYKLKRIDPKTKLQTGHIMPLVGIRGEDLLNFFKNNYRQPTNYKPRQANPENKPKVVEGKAAQDTIDTSAAGKDPILRPLGRGVKELETAHNSFITCVRGVIKDAAASK